MDKGQIKKLLEDNKITDEISFVDLQKIMTGYSGEDQEDIYTYIDENIQLVDEYTRVIDGGSAIEEYEQIKALEDMEDDDLSDFDSEDDYNEDYYGIEEKRYKAVDDYEESHNEYVECIENRITELIDEYNDDESLYTDKYDKEKKNKILQEKIGYRVGEKDSNKSNEELCVEYQNGNEEALNILFANNIGLIKFVCKRYGNVRSSVFDMEDLIQQGMLGVNEAATKFDVNVGVKYSTYAFNYIRKYVNDFVSDNSGTIKLTRNKKILYYKMLDYEKELKQKGISSEKERMKCMVEHFNTTEKAITELLLDGYYCFSAVSMDAPIKDDEDDMGDFIADKRALPEDVTVYNSIKEIILSEVNRLSGDTAKNVMRLRLGLEDGVNYSYEEVGKKLGLSLHRIKEVEAKSLRRLRNNPKLKKLKNDIDIF